MFIDLEIYHCKEDHMRPSSRFLTRSNTKQAVRAQIARGWKFWILTVEELYYPCSGKKKVLISFAFVFPYYVKCWFPHDVAHIITNQRTNGPVNAHLKPEIYTNKLV